MMHHHHTIPQRGDPNRIGGQHRLMQNQQRGHPIMLGVPGASPVSPQGDTLWTKRFVIFIVYYIFCLMTNVEANLGQLSSAELAKIFGPTGCIEGVLVSVPVQSIPSLPQTMSIHQSASVQQSPQASPTMYNQTTQQESDSNKGPVELASKLTSQTQQHSNTVGNGVNTNATVTLLSSPPTTNMSESSKSTTGMVNTNEKTPMCLVNELARFNKIQHIYRLTGEQGPAHKKRFTVVLKLASEKYQAEGSSIKKAQHAAASEALLHTTFKHPPSKTARANRKSGARGYVPPTVELNMLAMKLGKQTVYLPAVNCAQQSQTPNPQYPPNAPNQNNFPNNFHRNNMYNPNQRFNHYDGRRYYNRHYNHHFDNQRYPNFRVYGGKHGGWHGPNGANPDNNFVVTLRVGSLEFLGEGPTLQAARHDAASRALTELKTTVIPEQSAEAGFTSVNCQENDTTTSEDITCDLKSPISLVHEIALKRNLCVSFEVKSELGLAHKKSFITVCRVADLVTEGEGNGKKMSKRRAAEKMLEELKKLPPLSPNINVPRLKRKSTVTKKKTRSLIKEKSDTKITEKLNPISKLIQIQQVKKEREPVYTLIEEKNALRRREFVMEVSIGTMSARGSGPNKKQAKRVATEALLAALGYEANSTESSECKSSSPTQPKGSTQNENSNEKMRKVTFLETEPSTQQPVGGSAGRQLVPGLILMGDQSNTQFSSGKSVNIQTTATIAKEFLKAGSSPTADALAKAGQNTKLSIQNQHGTSPGTGSASTTGKATTQVIRPKDQLLYLSQLLGFQTQFSDFSKANHEEFLTLLSISTDPPQVCHGAGESTDESHDAAALSALRILSEMGLDNVAPNKKEPPINIEGVHHNNKKTTVVNSGLINAATLSNGIKK